jgi:hypothetical protein
MRLITVMKIKGQPEAIYKSRGITDLIQLNADDAAVILGKLVQQYMKHEAAEKANAAAAATTTAAPSATRATGASDPTATAAQSSAVATSAPSAVESRSDLASAEQVAEITMILGALQLPGQPQQIFTSRKITDLSQLKREDAAGIIAKLKPKFDEHRAKQAASGNTVIDTATDGKASPPPAVVPADPDRVGTINEETRKKILTGFNRLKVGADDIKRILAKMKTQGGAVLQSIPDMSFNQGELLLSQMTARIHRDYPGIPF